MLIRRLKQRGDTLIEVLFAVTVFSLVAVGGISIMNQGTNTSERALEITLVRQEIDAQAEALRFLHDAYVTAYQTKATYPIDTPQGQWAEMLKSIIATDAKSASEFGNATTCPVTAPNGSFIINARAAAFVAPDKGKLQPASLYSRVNYGTLSGKSVVDSSEGIWIEAVRSATSTDNGESNAGFIDFHIRACWETVSKTAPVTLGTIVRLYEPRG